ncbi:unnamed protein product [Rotaria sp. Silwood2]|nr:unnamed protein product [Rotaria sp. Silwood2]CAF2800241.1 unnamed protein product [Rotaria sp. Silwood2]CAF3037033.1 unnamed protein product [Rotaria sp. Silwood2]CAF3208078.1 unnamed protein product [Rotaria sp. Silwood2]CAF3891412.1 unnamed protein product [Rotaria sp. Silwood2]
MEDIAEEQQQTEINEYTSTAPLPIPTDETTKIEQAATTSLVQSLLQGQADEIEDKKKKKKKKGKAGREKEIERLKKSTKGIFASPEKLNGACERINALLTNHKKLLLGVCQVLDKLDSGHLSYEQFRLVIKDRLPIMSREDLFILMKLFENEGFIDYRAILDQELSNGILRHIVPLTVPPSKEIILEKKLPKELKRPFYEPLQLNHPKYVTLHLRLITFDSYHAYPGHIRLTVPDHMSIYALSKMVIDETDLATRSISIFREKVRSRHGLLEPMLSLEDCRLTGAYVDGTHNQPFPTYTLYYDYSPMDIGSDCPILKCDYFIK